MTVYVLFTCHDGDDDGYVIAVYEQENHAIEDMNKRKQRDIEYPLGMKNYYEVQSFDVI